MNKQKAFEEFKKALTELRTNLRWLYLSLILAIGAFVIFLILVV